MTAWNTENEKMDLTPFFILMKAFVSTTADELLMNDFLNKVLEKILVFCVEKNNIKIF